jgi:Rrf2 family protein
MFNKETEYALRGLVYIQLQNTEGRRPGIAEIAKEIDAPQFYTAKILQRLVRTGFVVSLKGKGGGFFFDQQKASLPLRDIIVATEGDKTICGCGFGLKSCSGDSPCPLHEQYAPIREAILTLVSTETIQSLATKYISKLSILPPVTYALKTGQ